MEAEDSRPLRPSLVDLVPVSTAQSQKQLVQEQVHEPDLGASETLALASF